MLILQSNKRINLNKSHQMNNISIYTLTSELHDAQAVNAATQEFLNSLQVEFNFKENDYTDYGQAPLSLIYVRTGGTEGIFRRLLPQLQQQTKAPIYLLTSGKSNSLAASCEILSYLRQQGIQGEIIHGSADYLHHRILLLCKVGQALRQLQGCRIGVVGKPSDWLISSTADYAVVKQQLGMDIIDIPMQELLDIMKETPLGNEEGAMQGAMQIYHALKKLAEQYQLQGLTIRCFDLLTAVHNTGCIALAKLNSEGVVAGCEGDIPTLLSMMITKAVCGVSGFQANPAHIDPEKGQMLFAHCTIPFNMVERYELDTHFESGIGVGIRGFMKNGPVTVFKVSGNLSRHFVAEGELVRSEGKPDLCRTQQIIQLADPQQARYFLTDSIGNHHVIMPGHQREVLDELFKSLK